ncbi:MAG: hypothetical protein ACRDNG_09535 [Gaiellaceae bacterium]
MRLFFRLLELLAFADLLLGLAFLLAELAVGELPFSLLELAFDLVRMPSTMTPFVDCLVSVRSRARKRKPVDVTRSDSRYRTAARSELTGSWPGD